MLDAILNEVDSRIHQLENHQIYKKINTIKILRLFMERHIYAVFDFMSLTKSIQAKFSPIEKMWTPPENRELSRFINEIVLAEESDIGPDNQFMSHFEIYSKAITEIKGQTQIVERFIKTAKKDGFAFAATNLDIPRSARNFMADTFSTVSRGKIHEIAASFCFGRENIIPTMFKTFLNKMNISEIEAPLFHYYLKRHIEIDSKSHGPMAQKMLCLLCDQDPKKWQEVRAAAIKSIESRIDFWDNVSLEIEQQLFTVNVTESPGNFNTL